MARRLVFDLATFIAIGNLRLQAIARCTNLIIVVSNRPYRCAGHCMKCIA